MDVFTDLVAIVSLTGIVGVALGGALIGVGMPLVLLVGVLAPEGSQRSEVRDAKRSRLLETDVEGQRKTA